MTPEHQNLYFTYKSLHPHYKQSLAQLPTSSKSAGCLEKGGAEYMQIFHGNDGNMHFQFYKGAWLFMPQISKFCQLLLFEITNGDKFSKTNKTQRCKPLSSSFRHTSHASIICAKST